MPLIAYEYKDLRPAKLNTIREANRIIAEYAAGGYALTLRQLYYQFVARDLLPNSHASYKMLGKAVSDGRMNGLIDWSAIEDRTRNLEANPHWSSPADILKAAAQSYANDKWRGQEYRVEIWVEKEALAGVVARPAKRLDVDYFCCRGYVSQSEQWAASQRFRRYAADGQKVVILHLGDHDPSGIDMTRDIDDRLFNFLYQGHGVAAPQVERIALNMDQIEELKPPPNYAKATDARYGTYRERFGTDSWELDALPPDYLDNLIETNVLAWRDEDVWDRNVRIEESGTRKLYSFIEQLKNGD